MNRCEFITLFRGAAKWPLTRLRLTIALALFATFLSVSSGRADNRASLEPPRRLSIADAEELQKTASLMKISRIAIAARQTSASSNGLPHGLEQTGQHAKFSRHHTRLTGTTSSSPNTNASTSSPANASNGPTSNSTGFRHIDGRV